MRIIPVSSINRHSSEDVRRFVRICEEEYYYQIKTAVRSVERSAAEKPILLISGPSGSGKTITAHRIREMLSEDGHTAHILSMDDYFLPLGDPRGVDLEAPARLDIPLLTAQLERIIEGEAVDIPIFDFKRQKRAGTRPFHRKKDEIVIMEGIHALNPEITGFAEGRSVAVYVSVRTRLRYGGGELLHPGKLRLMRRLVRDGLFRNRAPAETVSFFSLVERGEQRYIMPYKSRADHDIDTFVAYEPAVYKSYIEASLREYMKQEEALDVADLLTVIEELSAVDAVFVPDGSLVREFVGKSRLMNN